VSILASRSTEAEHRSADPSERIVEQSSENTAVPQGGKEVQKGRFQGHPQGLLNGGEGTSTELGSGKPGNSQLWFKERSVKSPVSKSISTFAEGMSR